MNIKELYSALLKIDPDLIGFNSFFYVMSEIEKFIKNIIEEPVIFKLEDFRIYIDIRILTDDNSFYSMKSYIDASQFNRNLFLGNRRLEYFLLPFNDSEENIPLLIYLPIEGNISKSLNNGLLKIFPKTNNLFSNFAFKLRALEKELMIKSNISELFPNLSSSHTAIIKREVYKNILDYNHVSHLMQKYSRELDYKFPTDGKSVREILESQRDWIDNLDYKDFEYFVKLFSFIRDIKFKNGNRNNGIEYYEDSAGMIAIKSFTNDNFFQYFLKKQLRYKNYLNYRPSDKKDFLLWLRNNMKIYDVIKEIPSENKSKLVRVPEVFYTLEETVDMDEDGDKNLLDFKNVVLYINTNIIPDEFRDYIEIDDFIFSAIDLQLKKMKQTEEYKRMNKIDSLSKYYRLIFRYYLLIKSGYNRERNQKIYDKGKMRFIYNKFEVTDYNLDVYFGNLRQKVRRHLILRNAIRPTSFNTNTEIEFYQFILNMIFTIAHNLKWIIEYPKTKKNGTYQFKLNPHHFDAKYTAEIIAKEKKSNSDSI